ncbi:MAG: hypothetical protein QGM50_10395 [Anaerolineae bacterium]|nr:hypothetical protein [Anaerolineae bacterium]
MVNRLPEDSSGDLDFLAYKLGASGVGSPVDWPLRRASTGFVLFSEATRNA